MIRRTFIIVAVLLLGVSGASAQQGDRPTHLTYVRRDDSREGDFKVVVVPATNPRQAKIDAQTYHIGWNAVDSWMGQSRVMYCVLLKKRDPYIPGTVPVPRPIPKERQR